MTAIRIRHEDDTEARHLGDVPFADLDTVIPTIRTWGVDGEEYEMSGQFRYPEVGDAFFEVVLNDPEGP
jgi:hypothetical protein